jgi:ABC-type sulfate/molybdate transport systems ATPase subunit
MSLSASIRAVRGTFDLDVHLTAEPGRTLVLLGPNGAGKSTVLAALAGTVPSEGAILINGRAVSDVETARRRVGYVFQDYLLFPHLTVIENVAFGPRAQGVARPVARATAAGWLERLGIPELADRRPTHLSGGQAQRVALARALASGPELLLLDEPLAALDVEVRGEVREELARHLREWGGLTIVVTHSLDDVAALADDVVVLENGRETQRSTVRELVRSPATPYVERLVAAWRED